MSLELLETPVDGVDPLDLIEQVAVSLDLDCERVDDTELHVVTKGAWRDTGIWFTWRPELSTLQLGAPLDLKVPEARMADAFRLVGHVNERLWIGHYDLWSEDQSVVYRNAAVLPENGYLDPQQAEILIKATAEAVERFFPAFNFLIWGEKSPEDALQSAMFETQGSA
ncbi:MAG: YbjN domain-containing protein [Pseudomonadota bacterium]